MDQNTDIYAKAASELASIDAQIASLEKRRSALRQFIELGQRLFTGSVLDLQPGNVYPANSLGPTTRMGTPTATTTTREQSLKARVLALSKQAIQEQGPQSTNALVAYIEDAGVTVTGAHKPTTVSVILSRSDEFKSDRKVGWVLTEPAQKELTP
jgi:hypothetical protein